MLIDYYGEGIKMSTKEQQYKMAQDIFADFGVDTNAALDILRSVPISMHCWQLDDLTGFEDMNSVLSGGIQATGNAPGKPKNIDEYMQDLNLAMAYIPGPLKLALHAIYRTGGKPADRDALTPAQFELWVDFAREKNIGLDFNPTYFSHPMASSGLTLTSEDSHIRDYWISHGASCRRIGEYFGKRTGWPCITNHWVGDGSKDQRIDKLRPRELLMDSLNKIFAEPIDPRYNIDSVESKLFGIGAESYTPGSHEFYTNYVMSRRNCILCLDTGHFHPTESVADKLSAYLCFGQELMLHVSRPVRWDSDHVVILDDDTYAVMKEIVRCDALKKVHIGTDYFDASIDRVAATVIGVRSVRKALLYALLQPNSHLKSIERAGDLTKRLAISEEAKLLPFGIVWERFCEEENISGSSWFDDFNKKRAAVLSDRMRGGKA